ncbi:hypothetical protein JCM3765_007652 [Sporobolomyces pararoseus]
MNQHITIRQVIEGGAASSLPVYAHAFSRSPASPCLTGWSTCIFALEDNGSNLVRRILEQESSIGENTVENVVLRTKWPDSEKDYKMRGKVYPRIDHFFPRNAKDGDVFVSRSGNIGTAKLSYLRPRILDLSLSASALAECYVLYHKTASDGTPQYFRLLSGPLFILTRLSLAIALPERRIEIWKQLLVYLLSVNSLPTGEFRNSFHLVDHEKWVELVLSNSDSTIIGHSAHREMKNWLERPLEQIHGQKRACRTTKQDFQEIAESFEDSEVSREEVYNKLVQLRSDLAMELRYIVKVLEFTEFFSFKPHSSPDPLVR